MAAGSVVDPVGAPDAVPWGGEVHVLRGVSPMFGYPKTKPRLGFVVQNPYDDAPQFIECGTTKPLAAVQTADGPVCEWNERVKLSGKDYEGDTLAILAYPWEQPERYFGVCRTRVASLKVGVETKILIRLTKRQSQDERMDFGCIVVRFDVRPFKKVDPPTSPVPAPVQPPRPPEEEIVVLDWHDTPRELLEAFSVGKLGGMMDTTTVAAGEKLAAVTFVELMLTAPRASDWSHVGDIWRLQWWLPRLEKQQRDLTALVRAETQEAKRLKGELERLQQEIAAENEASMKAAGELDALGAQVQAQLGRLRQRQGDAAEVQDETEGLRGVLIGIGRQQAEADDALRQLEEECASLQGELGRANAELESKVREVGEGRGKLRASIEAREREEAQLHRMREERLDALAKAKAAGVGRARELRAILRREREITKTLTERWAEGLRQQQEALRALGREMGQRQAALRGNAQE